MSSRVDLAELELSELEAALAARGQERFRARQLFSWIYRRGVTDMQSGGYGEDRGRKRQACRRAVFR